MSDEEEDRKSLMRALAENEEVQTYLREFIAYCERKDQHPPDWRVEDWGPPYDASGYGWVVIDNYPLFRLADQCDALVACQFDTKEQAEQCIREATEKWARRRAH
jgi:hypothetical protein